MPLRRSLKLFIIIPKKEDSSFSAKLHLVQLDRHALANTSSTSLPWVVDSGATEHMTTSMEQLFSSYSKPKSINSLRIADGSYLPVKLTVLFSLLLFLDTLLWNLECPLTFYQLVI